MDKGERMKISDLTLKQAQSIKGRSRAIEANADLIEKKLNGVTDSSVQDILELLDAIHAHKREIRNTILKIENTNKLEDITS